MWVAVSVGRRHEGCEGKSGGGGRDKLDAGMECTEVVDTAGEVPFTAPMGLVLILCRDAEKVRAVEFE